MTTIHRLASADHEAYTPALRTALTSTVEDEGGYIAFTKGAVDSLTDVCTWVWHEDQCISLDDSWRDRIVDAAERLAATGVRVLGVAFRPLADLPQELSDKVECELVFVGIVGMVDPPRAEAAEAVYRVCCPGS